MSNRRKPRSQAEWVKAAREFGTVLDRFSPETLQAAIQQINPALADQMQAATAESLKRRDRGLAAYRAARPGDDLGEVKSDQTGRDQMAAHYLRIITGLADGSVSRCPHVDLKAPRPWIAVVFGNRVDCHDCHQLAPRPVLSEREEHTCDLCRGYQPQQTMHSVFPQVAHLTLAVGVCEPCLKRMGWRP